MNLTCVAPLAFFHLLADRNGSPSGLLLELAAGESDAWPWLAECTALGAGWPCFYRAGLAPLLAEALQAAGWHQLDAGTLARVDGPLLTHSLAPAVAWIVGDWCMTAPARAQGKQAASRALSLQLVQLVAADADTHAIEALLRRDPTLSYHLLRLVNSLGSGTGRRVTSFAQAILILGRQQLRRWLNLMLFAAREGDVRSAMLLARVAVRARALELLARERGLDRPTQDQAFMAGMFSLLGTLFGMPLAEVLAPLAISEAVQGALLRHEGELGALLQIVESAERAERDEVASQLASAQIGHAEFNQVMVSACGWMLDAVRDKQGSAHA